MIRDLKRLLGIEDRAAQLRQDLALAMAALERQTRWHGEATVERDAARDQVMDLEAENRTLRKTNGMFRSLIGILRDVNRDLDERNVYLEQLHGMTSGERLEAAENDAPDGCTKTPDEKQPWYMLQQWEQHGSNHWGIGVAIDLMHLEQRVTALEEARS